MNETLELLCESLEGLSDAVAAKSPEQRELVTFLGWHSPAITPEELASIPRSLANQIRVANIDEITEELEEQLSNIPQKLNLVKTKIIPQMFNGNNSPQAVPAYMTTIQWVSSLVQPLLYWESFQDPKAMPPMLAKKLRSLKQQLEDVEIDDAELQLQIKLINEVTETAESLPADLISLKEARKKVSDLSSDAIKDSSTISTLKEKSIESEKAINSKIQQADKLIHQCEEAYRVTTTKGLAGAFEERASKLSTSMWIWVVGLLIALSVGAYIGAERLKLLTDAMSASTPDFGIIAMQFLLSALSLGAPLWFAWLATKQIGHRFKLSEDYAFKASVAKAYEGYRKEAARIDEAFEARLFSTALTRVEEAPLRLVEENSHGSPWHELVSSPEFREAIDNIPEFRDKFIELAKKGMDSVKDINLIKQKAKIQAQEKTAEE
ncbi:MAG: hypothetical protein ACPGR2_14680 [Psychrobium sp.]